MSANIEVAEVDDRRDAQAPIASAGTAKHGTNFALDTVLYPADSYKDGVYWADLPYGERVAWVNAQSWAEAKRELGIIGALAKEDPLAPVHAYFSRYVITGMGLFVEGYTLFSIGNLSPLFKVVWPACWNTNKTCNVRWINAIDYLEIAGIICGQILVGFEGDWVGRKFGLVQDAVVMLIGTILLTAMWGTNLNNWIILYCWSLFIYGIGVGGEYPMTSTRALEIKGLGRKALTEDRLHRGRNVSLSFLMQGWGQLVNQVILILLLIVSNPHRGNEPYTKLAVQYTFRLQFAFVGIVTLWLLYYRIFRIKGADATLRAIQQKDGLIVLDGEGASVGLSGIEKGISRAAARPAAVRAYDVKSLKLTITFFWHRLIGTAGGWFCNDFFFYGNKIFAGVFIKIIHPKGSVMTTWLYNLINIAVSLVGYYMAAFFIDYKFYGRNRMQAVGFLCDFALFIAGAAAYPTLTKEGSGVKSFQFIYFFSSFWNQFGPNSTTFLLAAEVYPTSIRSTAHGFSAAWGKLGALAPAILYNYIGNRTKFWVVSWFGLLGCLLTVVFVPDTTGLDLREQERYWDYVRNGREHEYHGICINPRHLSWFENTILKKSRYYDPELDHQSRLDDLRREWEAHGDAAYVEPQTEKESSGDVVNEGDEIDAGVRRFFEEEAASRRKS